MPRGYGGANRAARDAMYRMYDEYEELPAQEGGGFEDGATNYDSMGNVAPDSMGGDLNLGVSGMDEPRDGAGMAAEYTPSYGGRSGGMSDGARNVAPKRRRGNPYLEDQ